VAGLAVAWRAAQSGLRVLVLERDRPGAGASSVAAGMLAPVTEAEFGEEELLRLNLESAAMWPGFAAELEERTGMPTGYAQTGALVVAADRDDAEELHRLHGLQRSLGLDADWLTPTAARALEPGLAPRIAGAIDAPAEAQADPVALVAALCRAIETEGGEIVAGADARIRVEGERVAGVELRAASKASASAAGISAADAAMDFVAAGSVVLAAGAWSAELDPSTKVRPVKGQLVHLRTRAGAPALAERIIRTPRCYVVPRADGRVIVGATSEERGFDTTVDAGAVHRLLEAAWEVLPDVWELEFVHALAGLRPGTPDNRPLVGPGPVDGLIHATGHYRNGILLAPITAARVTEALTGERVPA
jgi:glycine oxidase